MIQEINELERELDVSHEDVLTRLNVDSLNQLTDIQLVDVINNLKKVKKWETTIWQILDFISY